MHCLLEERPLGIVNKLHLVVLVTAVCLSMVTVTFEYKLHNFVLVTAVCLFMVAVTFEHKLHIVVLAITVCLSMGTSDLWARCCLSYNFCGLGDTEVCNLKNSRFISSITQSRFTISFSDSLCSLRTRSLYSDLLVLSQHMSGNDHSFFRVSCIF